MLRRLRTGRRLTASAVVIALGSAAGAEHVAAAEELVTQRLPGRTIAGLVVDLDDDGSSELARLVDRGDGPALLEVWRLAGATWELHGSEVAPVVASGAEVADPAAAASLLSVEIDGRATLVLHTAVVDLASPTAESCCVVLHDVRLDDEGLRLDPFVASPLAADTILAADMDDDGTDEIVMVRTRYPSFETPDDPAVTTITVQRRIGDAWVVAFEQTRSDLHGTNVTAAETDGLPGMDLIVMPGDALTIGRITLHGGAFHEEGTGLPRGDPDGAWIAGFTDRMILVSEFAGFSALRWDADGAPELVERISGEEWPQLATFGEGADTMVVIAGSDPFGGPRDLAIRNGSLDELGLVETSPLAAALNDLLQEVSQSNGYTAERSIWPFVGSIPGGWTDGRAAYAAAGTLIRPDGDNGFTADPMATLVGVPLGFLGPDREWMAVCDGCYGEPKLSFPNVGDPWGAASLAIVPTSIISAPDATDAPAVTYEGAIPVGESADPMSTEVRARADGSTIVIHVPAGTAAVSFDGRTLVDHGEVESEVRVEVEPRSGRSDEFEQAVVLIGQDMRPTLLRWHGTYLPERPDLSARVDVEALSLSATISGHASPGSTVTVDGMPVAVSDDGAFSTRVDAPPWPRSVAVAANDGFGGERITQVAVIGLIDYRTWPWVAIVGALVGVGAIRLFLRTPSRHERPVAVGPDEGVLEELDGDAV